MITNGNSRPLLECMVTSLTLSSTTNRVCLPRVVGQPAGDAQSASAPRAAFRPPTGCGRSPPCPTAAGRAHARRAGAAISTSSWARAVSVRTSSGMAPRRPALSGAISGTPSSSSLRDQQVLAKHARDREDLQRVAVVELEDGGAALRLHAQALPADLAPVACCRRCSARRRTAPAASWWPGRPSARSACTSPARNRGLRRPARRRTGSAGSGRARRRRSPRCDHLLEEGLAAAFSGRSTW